MPDQQQTHVFSLAFWHRVVVIAFFTIAGLVLAADVLVPLSIASLIFILLTSAVDRLCQVEILGTRIPRWLAHVISAALLVLGLLGLLSILTSQAGAVADALPRYEARFSEILARVVTLVGDKNYQAAQQAILEMDFTGFAGGAIGSAGSFLSAFFLILLYIPFMMLEQGPMRLKVALAAPDAESAQNLHRVLTRISESVQRYVGIKTLVSFLTGVGSYAIMKPVGLDFAETWAILAFVLNFIPTIGSIIGVALPSLVALVQFDTNTPFLIILVGCGAVQFIIGNILEPSLTGKSLNLSPLMVILALTFWTAIWGIPGALLSVPITVCTMIVLANIPSTKSLAILMSGDGNLSDGSQKDNPVREVAQGEASEAARRKSKLTVSKSELDTETEAIRQEFEQNLDNRS
ncbi:AI-2E family transporter [Ruegeria faecimaris]|uniref:AI-2E family transporter n=1 Tax=Ruegeria faecimaris TaxID=686389 RepID=UPI00232B7C62|nr:AI-2E family transporter [Ruegeria faecimaris]